MDELADIIRFHRIRSGLTQSGLARVSGVGKTVVFDIEKGKQTIRLSTLVRILKTLNIKILFTGPIMDLYMKKKNAKS